jgi:hypothetical protein
MCKRVFRKCGKPISKNAVVVSNFPVNLFRPKKLFFGSGNFYHKRFPFSETGILGQKNGAASLGQLAILQMVSST